MKEPNEILQQHGQHRRNFIKSFAKLSAAAPAVALLLSQSTIVHAASRKQEPTDTQPTPSGSDNPL